MDDDIKDVPPKKRRPRLRTRKTPRPTKMVGTTSEIAEQRALLKVQPKQEVAPAGATVVLVERLNEDAVLPAMKTTTAACFDLTSTEDINIKPGRVAIVPTGLKFEMPENYEAQIRARSSLAAEGIIVANGPGTVDSDYRGEIKILLLNTQQDKAFAIKKGDRVGQVAFRPVPQIVIEEVEKILTTTERGEGAMGSTGRN